MATSHFRTAALLVAGITLTASPSFAQRDGRRNGDEGGRREAVERASPATVASPATQSQARGESRAREESQRASRSHASNPATR